MLIIYKIINSKKAQLDEILRTYTLMSTVKLPTRITKNTETLIDDIFIYQL
jgi:hypothetical protein